jgi:K+-sensing histidine kinase KdpD
VGRLLRVDVDVVAWAWYAGEVTNFVRVRRDRIAVWAGLLVPLGACAALVPVRGSFPNTDAALALVAVVVAVAASGNRAAGLLAAASAAVWFDFFLTVPYERFAITHRTDLQTTLLLVAVGAAVTELAALARRRSREAAADEALLAVVASTGALVARGEPSDGVVEQVNVQLTALLGARGCQFEPGDAPSRGLHIAADGTVTWGATAWKLAEHGFPAEPVMLAARHGGRVWGHFAVDPTPGTAPSLDARQTAVIIADLAGAALARDDAHHPHP